MKRCFIANKKIYTDGNKYFKVILFIKSIINISVILQTRIIIIQIVLYDTDINNYIETINVLINRNCSSTGICSLLLFTSNYILFKLFLIISI